MADNSGHLLDLILNDATIHQRLLPQLDLLAKHIKQARTIADFKYVDKEARRIVSAAAELSPIRFTSTDKVRASGGLIAELAI